LVLLAGVLAPEDLEDGLPWLVSSARVELKSISGTWVGGRWRLDRGRLDGDRLECTEFRRGTWVPWCARSGM
jgi:hypothetical protein